MACKPSGAGAENLGWPVYLCWLAVFSLSVFPVSCRSMLEPSGGRPISETA